ncbi:NADH-quinone oxidoreductase subunit C [Glycomyces tritici]|uniref:NADH-quinone oxidoreductase subunit C n=1 Tax=Glycomyces tritici TaxID=2665176 RepID=A0ABT7YS03_9ACTN|nr:NADH-quinone oxidoreductase subunit C [Glycomyces tritici]MDN3241038.1 NADH-quinone oxidoreductase subunit C [Glycomyces tritici]
MPDFWEDRVRAALGIDELGADGPRAVADVDPKDWHAAVRACRDEVGCDFFDWLSAVDEGPAEPAAEGGPPGPIRFRVIAHLWSVSERRGVLLRALLTEGAIGSVVDLYPGADWHERETHEMFGVDFPGHPDLQPLLLAPEFEGHPLRKDFILASRVVKPWPGAKEPGEGQGQVTAPKHRQEGTVRKRAPKRPPGVPEDWIEPAADPAAAPDPRTGSAADPQDPPDATAPDPRLRRPDAS